jgi:hypothetical protein
LGQGPFQQFTGLILCFIIFKSTLSLPVDVPVLESVQLEPFNESLDARPSYISASNLLLERDDDATYERNRERGEGYICRLKDPALRRDQSPYTMPEQLDNSGWVQKEKRVDTHILGLFDPVFNVLQIPNIPHNNVNIKWK